MYIVLDRKGIISNVSTNFFFQIWSWAQAVKKLRLKFIAGLKLETGKDTFWKAPE